MTTTQHAIYYLQKAQHLQCRPSMSDIGKLRMVDPDTPCRAYGLAKNALVRAGSILGAIAALEAEESR